MAERRQAARRLVVGGLDCLARSEAGLKITAREPGKGAGKSKLKVIEAAPGSYARLRTDTA